MKPDPASLGAVTSQEVPQACFFLVFLFRADSGAAHWSNTSDVFSSCLLGRGLRCWPVLFKVKVRHLVEVSGQVGLRPSCAWLLRGTALLPEIPLIQAPSQGPGPRWHLIPCWPWAHWVGTATLLWMWCICLWAVQCWRLCWFKMYHLPSIIRHSLGTSSVLCGDERLMHPFLPPGCRWRCRAFSPPYKWLYRSSWNMVIPWTPSSGAVT